MSKEDKETMGYLVNNFIILTCVGIFMLAMNNPGPKIGDCVIPSNQVDKANATKFLILDISNEFYFVKFKHYKWKDIRETVISKDSEYVITTGCEE